MARRLFGENSISNDLSALEAILLGQDGEITDDEAGQAIEAWLNQVNLEVEDKVEGLCVLMSEFHAAAEAREHEAQRIAALATTDRNAAERIKRRIKNFFDIHKIKKLDTPRYRLWIQGNGGKAPLTVPEQWEREPASAPEQFQRRKIELDKDAIRSALTEFAEKANAVVSTVEDEDERPIALQNWLKSEQAQVMQKPIQGCAIGDRGTSLRVK
jgi:Gp157 protein